MQIGTFVYFHSVLLDLLLKLINLPQHHFIKNARDFIGQFLRFANEAYPFDILVCSLLLNFTWLLHENDTYLVLKTRAKLLIKVVFRAGGAR